MNRDFWVGRRVFLTGHTGFKGGWLALWLSDMGAKVYGYALPPPDGPSFYAATNVAGRLAGENVSDIRDADVLRAAISAARPEIVLHLAAQPLVRASYRDPQETYSVNVMGLVTLFEAARACPSLRAMVNVTTDKCYENREWLWPYREDEALGGHDPYSASKACSEIVTASYRRSFLAQQGIALASARAGNVIGGGDWATDRLIPDFLRALDRGETLVLRSPNATRPWQHVLEPLSGYLTLAEALVNKGATVAEAWNFGPEPQDIASVSAIVDRLCSRIEGAGWELSNELQPHEAQALALDSAKARAMLGWRARWRIEEALMRTLDWHLAWRDGADLEALTLSQIAAYEAA